MVAPTVGLGTLARLAELFAGEPTVLSVYVPLELTGTLVSPASPYELDSLLAGLVPSAGKPACERMRNMLDSVPEAGHGARGFGLFSSAEGALSVAVALPAPVQEMAVLEAIPWLEPLADMCALGDWGVVIVGTQGTRLLRGGARTLVEFAMVGCELSRIGASRGRAGVRSSTRAIVGEHVARISGLLLRAHRRRPFERLVVIAPEALHVSVEQTLHRELRERLAGMAALDLQGASPQQIGCAVVPILQASLEANDSLVGVMPQPYAISPLLQTRSL